LSARMKTIFRARGESSFCAETDGVADMTVVKTASASAMVRRRRLHGTPAAGALRTGDVRDIVHLGFVG